MAGNAQIGALRVSLGVDTAQFSEGLQKASKGLGKFGIQMTLGLETVALAIGKVVGAIPNAIGNAIDSADEMSKMASKIGVPVEELSKLKYAADLAGVSMEGLKVGVGKLAKNMAEVAAGKGPEAFRQLGISVTNSEGTLKSATEVMAEISDRFAAMPDGAQKTALAMQLMGKSGADMIPLLNGGSTALNELMAEAKLLGLEISAGTAAAAEQFNDNVSRMGYAVSGLTLGLTAALAPALATISDAMVEAVKGLLGLLEYLPVVGEYALVAGGALAVMFSPAILAAVGNLAVAIGAGLVGAVRLLTAAIAANPLGALAIAITGAVVAVYHFRDEIQKAIGIDVVQIAKDVVNFVIGSFVGAFEAIKGSWSLLPAALGDLVLTTANAVIAGVESMVNAVVGRIDSFIAKINSAMKSLPFGIGDNVNIGTIGEFNFGRLGNPYAGAMSEALSAAKAGFERGSGVDYVAEIGKAFTASTPAVLNMNKALTDTGNLLDDIAGGGGGKKGKDGKVTKLKESFDKVGEAIERAQESLGQGFSGVLEGLIDRSLTWKDALMQAGRELLKYLNQMNMAQGGQGVFGGGFLQGLLGGLVGFASGGTILPGGSGGIDSQLVAFRKSPNERVDITKPGQRLGGGAMHVTVGVDADANGNLMPFVTGVARNESARAAGRVAGAVPAMVDDRNDQREFRRIRPAFAG